MDFPVRTVDRHLAELGQKALHKGLFLPTDDIVQAGVRITGEQGQVWSSNPIFTSEDDVDATQFASSGFLESVDVPQMNHINESSFFQEGSEGRRPADAGNTCESDEIKRKESSHHSVTFEIPPFGGVAPGALETVDFEVYAVETPRFAMTNLSKSSDVKPHQDTSVTCTKERGVQTEETLHKSPDGGRPPLEYVMQSASETELAELRELQEMIENKDQEIVDLFSFLSKELSVFPEKISEAMNNMQMLQSMVEQKDLEIADLYSQMSQEVRHAMRLKHRVVGHPLNVSEEISYHSSVLGSNMNHSPTSFLTYDPLNSFPGQEGRVSVSPSNGPGLHQFFKVASPSDGFVSPGGSRVASSTDTIRTMSGSDYYEVELDYAAAHVARLDMVRQIKRLEEGVKKKEGVEVERDSVSQQMWIGTNTGTPSVMPPKVMGLALRGLNSVSPQAQPWRNLQELKNQTFDAASDHLQVLLG